MASGQGVGRTTGWRSVGRRVRRLSPRRLVALQTPPARHERALAAVEAVEAAEPWLPTAQEPVAMVAGDRIIARSDLPEWARTMLPSPWRHLWDPQDPGLEPITTTSGAQAIVRAKYDLSDGVKLRVAYEEPHVIVGVLPHAPFGSCGVTRTVRAHAVVGRFAPDLIPPLVTFGEVGPAGRYVVERWVDGRPLMTPSRLADALPQVIDGLTRVHDGYGISEMRLSRWAPRLAKDWASLADSGLVPADLHRQVTALIDRDAALRASWTHGDPVASNVIRAVDESIVLVDWENARHAPVMVDAAKLHVFAADPDATLEQVQRGLGRRTSGRSGYSPAEELALAHARTLAGHPRRVARLVGHAREARETDQAARRVERLAATLAA